MDDIGILRWFVEASRCRSFTGTAEKFGVTSSAVSQGIARLERDLGARLFNRTTRQLSLTSVGQAFLEKVEVGLGTLEDAVALIRDVGDEPAGLIRISVPSSFGKEGLLPVFAEFLRLHPNVDLDVSFHDGNVDLVQQGLDLALVRRGERSLHCVTRRLGRNMLVLAASPDYLEKRGIPAKPADLAAHDWIAVRFSSGTLEVELESTGSDRKAAKGSGKAAVRRYRLETRLETRLESRMPGEAGESRQAARKNDDVIYLPRSRITISEQNVTALDAALLGMGIAILSTNLVERHLRSGELKLLLPGYRTVCDSDVFIVYPHREYLPAKTRQLIDYVIERFPMAFELPYTPEYLSQFAAGLGGAADRKVVAKPGTRSGRKQGG